MNNLICTKFDKEKFYTFAPYLCGIIYGVLIFTGVYNFVEYLVAISYVRLPGIYEYSISRFMSITMSGMKFATTALLFALATRFNRYAFNKTPRTTASTLFVKIAPIPIAIASFFIYYWAGTLISIIF